MAAQMITRCLRQVCTMQQALHSAPFGDSFPIRHQPGPPPALGRLQLLSSLWLSEFGRFLSRPPWTQIPANWEQLRWQWEVSHATNAVDGGKAKHASFLSEMCTCTERTESGQFVLASGQKITTRRQPNPGRGLPRRPAPTTRQCACGCPASRRQRRGRAACG